MTLTKFSHQSIVFVTIYRTGVGRGGVCLGEVSARTGKLRSATGVECVWSGTDRFEDWFFAQYPQAHIDQDGGRGYDRMRKARRAA